MKPSPLLPDTYNTMLPRDLRDIPTLWDDGNDVTIIEWTGKYESNGLRIGGKRALHRGAASTCLIWA